MVVRRPGVAANAAARPAQPAAAVSSVFAVVTVGIGHLVVLGGAEIALDLAEQLAQALAVLVVDAGERRPSRCASTPCRSGRWRRGRARSGRPGPGGRRPARGATLDIVLGGKPADHLGDGRRLHAKGGGKVAHRLAVRRRPSAFSKRFLAGMEVRSATTDCPTAPGRRERPGRAGSVTVRRWSKPMKLSGLNNKHEICMTVAGGRQCPSSAQKTRISRDTRSRKAARTFSLLRFMSCRAR